MMRTPTHPAHGISGFVRCIPQAEAAWLRRCFGGQAWLDAAIAANLEELGYGG